MSEKYVCHINDPTDRWKLSERNGQDGASWVVLGEEELLYLPKSKYKISTTRELWVVEFKINESESDYDWVPTQFAHCVREVVQADIVRLRRQLDNDRIIYRLACYEPKEP